MMETESVGIVAEPLDEERCRVRVDRPILPGRWVYFAELVEAVDSPLAAALFALPDVRSVLIAHDKATIARFPPPGRKGLRGAVRRLLGDDGATADSWRPVVQPVASVIRRMLRAGGPLVSDAAVARMPNAAELRSRVQGVLDVDVNPVVAGHGGGVTIHEVIDNVLYLRLSGGCQGCGLAENTLKYGVEGAVRAAVPEIGEIFDLTDHASGANPYRGPALKR